MVEISPRPCVLGCAPLLDFRVVPIFNPAVVVHDFHAVIFVRDRTLGVAEVAGRVLCAIPDVCRRAARDSKIRS